MQIGDEQGGLKFSSYQTDPGVGDNYYHRPSQNGGQDGGQNGGDTPKGNRRRRRLKWLLRIALFFVALGMITALGGYLYFTRSLPSIDKVTDYQPPLATQLLSNNLEVIGEFATEYRHLTPSNEIPPLVRQAFIAAEDSRFFEHSGIDYRGIARAMLENIRSGRFSQGASTITQQLARALLLTPEKKLARKIKEAVLAYRIESHLSKDEILYLYLNQIYFGHGAYGVAAAARVFFNKDLNQLTLSETALLAGMPTRPSYANPFVNLDHARSRRSNVLRKMEDLDFISTEERTRAEVEPFVVNDEIRSINKGVTAYFTEHVRRYLIEKYGDEQLYQGGLKVYTSLSLGMQKSAYDAVRQNLHAIDKRQGYRGPVKQLNEDEIKAYNEAWQPAYDSIEPYRKMLPPPPPVPIKGNGYLADKIEALVLKVSKKKNHVLVRTQDNKGYIPFALMKWARKPNPDLPPEYDKIRNVSEALKKGDVVLVRPSRIQELPESEHKTYADKTLFALEQEPDVQGAIVAANPENGFVKAMIGGYDFNTSEFNRAVQAKRQPGSAFKPIIYAAALDKEFTVATPILDAPVVYDDPMNDSVWRPKNYDGKFSGEILFREAFIKSRNAVTVKILQSIGIDYVIDYARKIGIESELTRDNTLALGSSGVTPLEMTQAFTTFAAGGVKQPLVFIKKIVDRDGNILERHTFDDPAIGLDKKLAELKKQMLEAKIAVVGEKKSDEENNNNDNENAQAEQDSENVKNDEEIRYRVERPGQVISEETAYLMTHLLSEVVRYGTGFRIRALNRPAAGKTGTTNDNIDAWFVGYTPNLVTTAWVGHDGRASMGKLETGSRAASPMWLTFMQAALQNQPERAFAVPGGVTFARIDAKTGKLAAPTDNKVVLEAFKDGTEPKVDDQAEQSGTSDFFIEQ